MRTTIFDNIILRYRIVCTLSVESGRRGSQGRRAK